MTKEEILHLATLARIKLSEPEVEQFLSEIDAVLGYVSQVDQIVADTSLDKTVGPVHNVFRDDEVTNEPGSYTSELLAAMPERHGDYLKVPKIINQD